MARLLLLGGSYLARSIIANVQKCINLYPEINTKDAPVPITHYQRPGFRPLARYDTPPPPPPDPPEPPPDPPSSELHTWIIVGDGNFGSGNELAIARSENSGGLWTDVRPPGAVPSTGNCVSGDGFGNWMIAAYQAIWISNDDGLTWTQVTEPVASQDWSYIVAVAERTFVLVRAAGPGTNYVFHTNDLGTTWTDVTPNGGAAIKLRNPATNGTGRVVIPHTDGGTTEFKAWVSEDYGLTYSETVEDNGYSNSNVISYTGGKFVVGLNGPGIYYSSTGLPGSWTLKSHSGLYTGTTGLYAYVNPYWFGNAEGEQTVTRTTDLAVDPSLPPSPGDYREFTGFATNGGIAIGAIWNDQGDPVYTGVYSTSSSLLMDSQVPPAAQDGANYYWIAYAGTMI